MPTLSRCFRIGELYHTFPGVASFIMAAGGFFCLPFRFYTFPLPLNRFYGILIAMKNTNNALFERTIYSVAHTDTRRMPLNNRERTLRLTVESNVSAKAIKVRFSNLYGENPLMVGAASLALCDGKGDLVPDTLVPLTVGGVLAFHLEPGSEVWSDTVPFALPAGSHFALNLYYPTDERVISGNWLGQGALRSKPGNYSADLQLHGPNIVSRFARTVVVTDFTVTVTTISEIVGLCPQPGRVLGCFGDSITQQSTWTEPLAKLLAHHYPGQISLCNLGIGGNRLLSDSPPAIEGMFGEAGIKRFERDLLQLPGLTHAILAIGTNDIGLPGSHGLPNDEVITLEAYTKAMEGLAARLHQQGVAVYAATLTPRVLSHPFDEEREALRQQMNHWIRTAPCFEAVLDFDAVLRREDGEPGMKDGCAIYDGLHPTPLGGMLLAKSINLELFKEGYHG